ncbi:MAG: ADP-ribosylglycohydrolase family protein [Clostridia bacterium]|nr:ADP-ribosylglycohydrolase family protein [Clostridia bacterium]
MRKISYNDYLDKVYGCFVGKAISGNIGAPHEGVKMPMEFEFMPEMINCSLPNDDLDLQVLWLDVLEKKGENFTSYDLLDKFVNCCSYSPGEYAVMRKNYMRGIYPPYSGKFCNDYYIEGMGCPIRSEIWGCVSVGNMRLADEFASRDGQLDHYGESVWAERFLAALESEAFFDSDIKSLISKAVRVLPENSKFRGLVEYTTELCEKYNDIKVVLTKLLFRYGHPDCTNMYQNMGITLASLLLGDGDIIKTSLMALNCGFDTDCTCATAGAIIGLLRGADELIKAYGLTEVTYALGVDCERRSNKIFDLAEDIARVGVQFAGSINSDICIEGAPVVSFDFEKLPEVTFRAEYEDMNPSISLGGSRAVTLVLTNNGDNRRNLHCSIHTVNGIVCSQPEFTADIEANSRAEYTVIFSLPLSAELVYDSNIIGFTVADESGSTVVSADFGLAGATPWKLCGPFWRTEPICNTQLLLEHFEDKHPYDAIIPGSEFPGSIVDKIRHFHLNFATDTKTEFVSPEELFEPLDDNRASCVYEQSLVNIPEDSFCLGDFFEFKGPCVAYMSRVIVADSDTDAYVQIGHSAPFALYINGKLAAQRDYCDNWTAENVHLEPIRLNKGENQVVLRATRVNADAKFNVTFSRGISMKAHIVSLASKNPYKF